MLFNLTESKLSASLDNVAQTNNNNTVNTLSVVISNRLEPTRCFPSFCEFGESAR